jgi:hypothetical protein
MWRRQAYYLNRKSGNISRFTDTLCYPGKAPTSHTAKGPLLYITKVYCFDSLPRIASVVSKSRDLATDF